MRIRTDLLADGAVVAAVALLILSAALMGVCSLRGPARHPGDGARALSSHLVHPRSGFVVVRTRPG